MYDLEAQPKKKAGCLSRFLWVMGILACGVIGMIAIAVIANWNNDAPTSRARPAATIVITPKPKATATPDWMALSYDEMCTNSSLTDIQEEDLAASMAGKKVVGWTGKVYDVERDGETYKVQVDVAGGIFFVRQVEILGVSRDVAAPLRVEQMITFDGTIQSVEMFAGDMCNPINIIDATIR